jgi:hypothetical protein
MIDEGDPMPEQRKIETTASEVRKGDRLRRQGAEDAIVIDVKRGSKKAHILTDASDKPLICEFIQPMTVYREFPTKDETIARLRKRLQEQLDTMKGAEAEALAKFVSRAKKSTVSNAMEWMGQELITASVETDIATRVAKAYDYHQREGAADLQEHPWELEDCVIAVLDEMHHNQVRYGRVNRSSGQMHNEVALQTQATIFEIVHRGYHSVYDTAQDIKLAQDTMK